MKPLQSENITQTLFLENERSIKENSDSSTSLMPAYIQQARMSTYFQDSPCAILLASQKYGLEPLGGPVTNQPNGYRPGNVCFK